MVRCGGLPAAGSNTCQPPPSALKSCTLSSSSCVLLSVAFDAHGQARALRVEQRQEIDLAAVVERLRTAERGFRRSRGALQQLRPLPLVAQCDERVLDVLERAHDRVLVVQHRFG